MLSTPAELARTLLTSGPCAELYVADRWPPAAVRHTVDATGTLTRYAIVGDLPAPAGVQVSGPLLDGQDWRAAALFVGP